MDYDYPLLRKVTDHFLAQPHSVSDTYLVCCQHLLEPQLHLFEELIRFGFDASKIYVLGKAYSTNSEIRSELSKFGINVYQPEFTGVPFDSEHATNCDYVLRQVPKGAPCIVLDDGADLIQASLRANTNVLFAVEQTSSGFRTLDKIASAIRFPVFNVARSTTKLVQESPFIARLSFERIQTCFKAAEIHEPLILIVGLGPIGEALREVCVENKYNVQGFDIKHGHTDLAKTINEMKPDVVCGATGFPILDDSEIDQVLTDKPMLFISVSSSDREFPVAQHRVDGTQVHDTVMYKNISFVNNGFPITFAGNRYECTPMEMEKTMCLLGGAVMFGACTSPTKQGMVDLPSDLETLVNSEQL